MGSIDEIVALNVFVRMRDLNLSQKNLGLLTGLTPAYINKLLKGKKPISKSSSLADIARALNLTETELYQDPAIASRLEAAVKSGEEAYANLRRLNRTLGEQLGETLVDLKEKTSLNLSPEERSLVLAFRSASPALRKTTLDILKAAIVPSGHQTKSRARPKKS